MFEKLLKGLLLLTAFSVSLGLLGFFSNVNNHAPLTPSVKTVLSTEPEPAPSVTLATKVKTISKPVIDTSRLVLINGEIGSEATNTTADEILRLGTSSNAPIYLLINSPGGGVFAGASIISAMESVNAPVYTICVQLCASMAAMIFEYGKERWMLDRSLVMFHPASGGAQGEVDKMHSRLSTVQRFIGKVEAYVAKRSNISFEKYKALSNNELWLDAEDSVNSGFADKLVAVSLQKVFTDGFINLKKTGSTTGKVSQMDFVWKRY